MANDKLNNMNVTSTRTGSAIDPLVEKIRGGIRTGVLTPGKMIGSEYDLARTGGISRGTVRRGIGNLIAKGWWRDGLEKEFLSGNNMSKLVRYA